MTMQSILTKYIGPTNTRGSKIKAVQSGWNGDTKFNSVTLPYDHALNSDENHIRAAKALAEKLGWRRKFVMASLGAQSRFAYCFAIVNGDGFDLSEGK